MLNKIAVILVLVCWGAGSVLTVNAEESITITTYYPSPYGSYNELQANKLAVGDTNGDMQLSAADQPPANGQLYTARSVIYKPQSSLPVFDVRKGELVYRDSNDTFYHYNGSNWISIGADIIGAQDGYAGQTGYQACNAIGKSCSRVISYNFIKEDANCPGATHCMRVCMIWYNQNLPGVKDGMAEGKDNIHSCDAKLGEYTTYLDPGVVRCNAFFSAICN